MGVFYAKGLGVENSEREAVRWFRAAADQNHADALYNLGVCYAYGRGVLKDLIIAACFHQMAIEKGEENAKNNLVDLELSKASARLLADVFRMNLQLPNRFFLSCESR